MRAVWDNFDIDFKEMVEELQSQQRTLLESSAAQHMAESKAERVEQHEFREGLQTKCRLEALCIYSRAHTTQQVCGRG